MNVSEGKMKTKTLCLVTRVPESIHAQRIIKGAITQCEKYGYSLAVFASMVHSDFAVRNQVAGDFKIYELVNYPEFDGIMIDAVTLSEDTSGQSMKRLLERLEAAPHGPVVTLGINVGDYECIRTDNEEVLRRLCRHVVLEHNKKNICVMTGPRGNEIAEKRLGIFLDELEKNGVMPSDEHIIYGNFWYTSGEKLGDDIANGLIEKPDAVICASDHMGLGLIQRLTKYGIRVPEDIVVVGFEGTDEAALNDISLTSCESNSVLASANAVDYLIKKIEPERELLPMKADTGKMFHLGMSCGCQPVFAHYLNAYKTAIYLPKRNYTQEFMLDGADMGLLMENYVLEQFTASVTPEKCLENIFLNTYLLLPYLDFYLCLRDDWLDTDAGKEAEYPEKMRLAVKASNSDGVSFCRKEDSVMFDTALMLPDMYEAEEPAVYYFSPVHFEEKTIGYSVLKRSLSDRHLPNLVLRTWLRFVNNALETVRIRERYVRNSVHDELTGLFNRRGMYEESERLIEGAKEGDSLLVAEIDMDGLKKVNDNFGHSEGDFALKTIAAAMCDVRKENEICVRAGGDEFYIIGVREYDENEADRRIEEFEKALAERSGHSGKAYEICASIGVVSKKLSEDAGLEALMSVVDKKMYERKIRRKAEGGR